VGGSHPSLGVIEWVEDHVGFFLLVVPISSQRIFIKGDFGCEVFLTSDLDGGKAV